MSNKNYKTLAIGDNIIDIYEKDNLLYAGGNALNFAMYSKMLSAYSSYLGVFGTDKNASFIIDIINKHCIDISMSKTIEGENGYVSIEINNGERNFLYGNSGGVGKSLSLDNKDLEYVKTFDIVNTNIISHFDKENEIKKIYSVNKNIAFDFSLHFDEFSLSKYCPFIKYALLSARHISEDATIDLIKSIKEKYNNLEIIIATRAEEGSIVFDGEKIYKASTYKNIEYKDSLGARDAYFACFLYSYIGQLLSVENSLNEASKFAANICTMDGAFGESSTIN